MKRPVPWNLKLKLTFSNSKGTPVERNFWLHSSTWTGGLICVDNDDEPRANSGNGIQRISTREGIRPSKISSMTRPVFFKTADHGPEQISGLNSIVALMWVTEDAILQISADPIHVKRFLWKALGSCGAVKMDKILQPSFIDGPFSL